MKERASPSATGENQCTIGRHDVKIIRRARRAERWIFSFCLNRAVTFDPINEPLPIDVDAGADPNEASLKAVALTVINPPANGLLTKGGKGRN